VKADSVKSDELLLAAMDAGAEDVLEPEADEDEDNDKEEEKYFQVITSLDQFSVVRGSLQEAGVRFDADISGPQLIPITTVKTDDEAMELNKVLTDKLLELDDVDAVYSNQK
jgi:transcriptional/translational regulatory protein YebC/TACO1